MRVLLLHPTYYSSPKCEPSSIYHSSPPLGLGYLAAILRNCGHDVMLFDIMGRDGELSKRFEYFKPEAVCISTMTGSYPQAYKLIKSIREDIKYEGYMILGGVHPSVETRKTIDQLGKWINAIVVGDGEGIINQAITEKLKGPLTTEPLDDLDRLPFPAWEMFELPRYQSNWFPVLTTRGCPFNCLFCSSKYYWKTVRNRSIENVKKEILYLKEKFGATQIMFYDDTFLIDKERVREINKFCKDEGIHYRCNGRINILIKDEWDEILDEMVGVCMQIDIGIESYSQEVLDAMNKHINKYDIIPVIEKLYSRKIGVNCYLIVSNYKETDVDRHRTIQFANFVKMRYPGVVVDLQILRVYPKTPLSNIQSLENIDWLKTLDERVRYPNVPIYMEDEAKRDTIINEFLEAKKLIVGW